MSQHSDDAWLDDQLRETPLPDGLLGRLRGCLELSDRELDTRILAVAVPGYVLGRLRDIPADVEVDAAVGAVTVPDELLVSLREIAKVERRLPKPWKKVRRFAAASLLTAAAAAAFLAFTLNWVASSVRFDRLGHERQIVVLDAPWNITARQAETETHFTASLMPEEIRTAVAGDGHWMSENETALVSLADVGSPPAAGPLGRMLAARDSGELGASVVLLRWGILASPQRLEDDLPIIEQSDSPNSGGMQPPLVKGYNRAFWLRHRVQPPLPTWAPGLKSISPPLVTSARSFERTQKAVGNGSLPPASEVRPEEFVAATVRYPLPAAGEIAISAAGGPSRYANHGTRLLQLGLQAGLPKVRQQPATDLIVLLDASASMLRSGRWASVRQGVAALPRLMSAEDRVTLTAFTDGEVLTLDDLSSASIPGALPALANVRPVGSFDLPAAIEFAASTVLARSGAAAAKRIAIITDDDNDLPANLAHQLQSLLQTLHKQNVQVDFIDAIGAADPQPQLLTLAEWSGGRASLARHAADITWSLAASLYGQTALVGSEVSVSVEFNPRQVEAYRVIGHEGSALSSMIPGGRPADLRASEAATNLFEVWLLDQTGTTGTTGERPDSFLATVSLSWKDVASSERRSATRRIMPADFRATFGDCPPAWQMAAIAAETGEMLRGSREVLREIGLIPLRRSTADDLLNDLRRVPAVPEMAQERERFNGLLEELRNRKLR